MYPQFNIATALTWFRIAAIPAIVVVFYARWPYARPMASMVFALAGFTDWLDGYLARRLQQTSQFGAFLDPVADKLMVATALLLIVQANPTILITLVAATIIGREITVSALREWMAELGARSRVAVSGVGKLKTIFQMVGVGCMLFTQTFFGLPVYEIGLVLLVTAAAITLWSMAGYIRSAWPRLAGPG
jgi:CDP-diacylglycerol--glycerol-3-phosphate 3-phosphatidyltransferase